MQLNLGCGMGTRIASVLALLVMPALAQNDTLSAPTHMLRVEVLGVGYNVLRSKQGFTCHVLRCFYGSGRFRVGTAFADLNGYDLTPLPLTIGVNLTKRTRKTGWFYSTGLETYLEGSLGLFNKDIYVEPAGAWFGPTGKLYLGAEADYYGVGLGLHGGVTWDGYSDRQGFHLLLAFRVRLGTFAIPLGN